MKTKWFLLSLIGMVLAGFAAFFVIFSLPSQPKIALISPSNEAFSQYCVEKASNGKLDDNGQLNLLVWNIYKQNRGNWQQSLQSYVKNKHLVLLQESRLTLELKNWLKSQRWYAYQVDAFEIFDTSVGVLNLSHTTPQKACAYTELEPWLRLPKSALYTTYPLSNGQLLAVINIHAVNFTYGTQEYQKQFDTLMDLVDKHSGPIIVAGDFNSWSEARIAVIEQAFNQLGLIEVNYSPDNRTQFITGHALDHVFYRGLNFIRAEAPISDASDHNPIEAYFELIDVDRPQP
ncbi:endonuclease/exonuclease/phosphatase family protein [Vibrio sp. OCN044]|uniref:Endonuclease/exonuclease/phosphatase family protein n=1 Tax=Vibrio tetraodonis subsp. pristinus TaxID=2695891 RepID=A0A6L8LU87_9VIBR|nr:endonuclease/exonuclease/phosphatase family protein [Vibrio tetraodonis]MYM59674.1 endonuclease/exonuclease/phosphatase family protein [Vibrio tetraodonis subsp. pristinus]